MFRFLRRIRRLALLALVLIVALKVGRFAICVG